MNVTLNESTNSYHKCKIKYYFPTMKSNLALFYQLIITVYVIQAF